MTFIIAQDPGKTTGIATWSTKGNTFQSSQFSLDEYYEYMNALRNKARAGVSIKFVSESFTITVQTAKNAAAPWSLENIGIMRFVAKEYNEEVKHYSPSECKKFATDAKLKKTGWHVPGQVHANDAARVLLVYCVNHVFDNEQLSKLT